MGKGGVRMCRLYTWHENGSTGERGEPHQTMGRPIIPRGAGSRAKTLMRLYIECRGPDQSRECAFGLW